MVKVVGVNDMAVDVVQEQDTLNIERIGEATQDSSENDMRTLNFRPYQHPSKLLDFKVYNPNFSPDSEYLAVSDYDNNRVIVFRTKTFNIVKIISVAHSPHGSFFGQDSDYLFVGMHSNGIEVYDTSDWSQVSIDSSFADEFSNPCKRIRYTRDNNYIIAVGSGDPHGYLQVFDISDHDNPSNWSYVGSNEVGPRPEDIDVSHDNKYYATIDKNGEGWIFTIPQTVQIQNNNLYANREVFEDNMGTDVRFSEYDEYIYWAAGYGLNKVDPEESVVRTDIDIEDKEEMKFSSKLKQVWSLDIARQGNIAIVGNATKDATDGRRGTSGGPWIVDLESQNVLQRLPPCTEGGHEINDSVFSPTAEYVAYTTYSNLIVWHRSIGFNNWSRSEQYTGTTTSSYADALIVDLRPFDESSITLKNTDGAESLYYRLKVYSKYFDGIETIEVTETSLASGETATIRLEERWARADLQVKDNSGNADYKIDWFGGD